MLGAEKLIYFIILLNSLVDGQTYRRLAVNTSGCTDGVAVRRYCGDIVSNPTALADYVAAFQAFNSGQTRPTLMDVFSQIHVNVQEDAHGCAPFFAFHRFYLYEVEQHIRTFRDAQGNRPFRNFGFCYWDSTFYSNDPTRDPILASLFQVARDTSNQGGCLNTSLWPNWVCGAPSTHCVTRRVQFGKSNPSAPTIQRLSRQAKANYDAFRTPFEQNFHSQPHIYMSGDMATMVSPCDAIAFYSHHTWVDYAWFKHQTSTNSFTAYNGRNCNGSTARATDPLPNYTDIRVSDVLSMQNLCYEYADPVRADNALLRGTRTFVQTSMGGVRSGHTYTAAERVIQDRLEGRTTATAGKTTTTAGKTTTTAGKTTTTAPTTSRTTTAPVARASARLVKREEEKSVPKVLINRKDSYEFLILDGTPNENQKKIEGRGLEKLPGSDYAIKGHNCTEDMCSLEYLWEEKDLISFDLSDEEAKEFALSIEEPIKPAIKVPDGYLKMHNIHVGYARLYDQGFERMITKINTEWEGLHNTSSAAPNSTDYSGNLLYALEALETLVL